MNIDKLIEEKTQCFVGNGDYYFTYITPEECKEIIKEALTQGLTLPIDSVSKCCNAMCDNHVHKEGSVYCGECKDL